MWRRTGLSKAVGQRPDGGDPGLLGCRGRQLAAAIQENQPGGGRAQPGQGAQADAAAQSAIESRIGAVTLLRRWPSSSCRRCCLDSCSVSNPRSSIRACNSAAPGFPRSFIAPLSTLLCATLRSCQRKYPEYFECESRLPVDPLAGRVLTTRQVFSSFKLRTGELHPPTVGVGTSLTGRPRRGSRRTELPYRALASGPNVKLQLLHRPTWVWSCPTSADT